MHITFRSIEDNESRKVVSEESYRVDDFVLPILRTFSSGLTVILGRSAITIDHIGPLHRDHAFVSGPNGKTADKIDNRLRKLKNIFEFPSTEKIILRASQSLKVTSPATKGTQRFIQELIIE